MKRSELVVYLPLYNALRKMKPDERVIVMSHFDDRTRDAIYRTVTEVLRSRSLAPQRRRNLARKLEAYKNEFRYLMDKRKGAVGKKRRLAQVGGAPMTSVLSTAVSMLSELFPKN